MARTVDMTLFGGRGGTNDCGIDGILGATGSRGVGQVALIARNRVPNQETIAVGDEDAAVAAAVDVAAPGKPQGEAIRGRGGIRRIQHGSEANLASVVEEEAEEGCLPVVGAEAGEEPGVRDEAAPALADRGGARERGRERREAEQDLAEEVVVVQRGGAGRRVALRSGGGLGTLRSPHQPAEAAALHLDPSSAPPAEATAAAPRTALSGSKVQIQIGG